MEVLKMGLDGIERVVEKWVSSFTFFFLHFRGRESKGALYMKLKLLTCCDRFKDSNAVLEEGDDDDDE